MIYHRCFVKNQKSILMNRIILIGNGFDLAHGLKTSYKNFIDDYWNGFIEYCFNQDRINSFCVYEYDCITLNMRLSHCTMSDLFQEESKKRLLNSSNKQFISFNEFNKQIDELDKKLNLVQKIQFPVNNKFLLRLLEKSNKETGWVDIENEYYKFLINKLNKGNNAGYYYNSIDALNDDYSYKRKARRIPQRCHK
jgi:hypothetical protein